MVKETLTSFDKALNIYKVNSNEKKVVQKQE